jgi:general secretion pathway protein K
MMGTSVARGYALVSVLWLVALLTVVTAAYHAQARAEAQLLAGAVRRAQAEGLAEAGIWIALRDDFVARATAPSSVGRVTRDVAIDDTNVAVTIADESGKINLNDAQPELLASAFAARTTLDANARAAVVDAILDWRDADGVRRPAGAEDGDYVSRKLGHGAKDALFATTDELLLVLGMTPTSYRQVAPLLTVFGSHTRVNVDAAPPDVLRALPTADGGPAGASLSTERLDQRFVQTTGEDIYTATGTATVGAVTANVAATVRYARGEKRPLQVLAWSAAPATSPLEEDAGSHAP